MSHGGVRMRHIRQGAVMRHIAAALAALGLAVSAPSILAQVQEVKVGLIAPLSGPWARQCDLMVKGAQMAIDDINNGGGITSMGGAKLRLVTADAGDSTEKAKNAAQRFVASEPDMVGATGAWLSSFTLAVTEVTERAELPVLTLSYSDQITARGFKYVFQTSPTGGAQANSALPALVKLAETATPDDKLCVEKLHEFGLGRGRVAVISNGAHIGAPDMLKNLGKDLLEGVM